MFTVVHTNGIHAVDLAFCGCNEMSEHGTQAQQLLRRRLFPATSTDPQTACTFALLKSAQLLSLQSKLSLYDYYISIEQLTDATGTVIVNIGSSSGRFPNQLVNVSEGSVQIIPTVTPYVAPHQDGKARRPLIRFNWNRGNVSRRACSSMPSVSSPFYQSTPQLALNRERSRVCETLHTFPLLLTAFTSGTSTTRCLALTLAFGSSGGRFRATRRIQNLAPGMPTSSHGIRIASTSVASPIKKRFVILIQHLSSVDLSKTDEHL
jgi:hypothetical protein